MWIEEWKMRSDEMILMCSYCLSILPAIYLSTPVHDLTRDVQQFALLVSVSFIICQGRNENLQLLANRWESIDQLERVMMVWWDKFRHIELCSTSNRSLSTISHHSFWNCRHSVPSHWIVFTHHRSTQTVLNFHTEFIMLSVCFFSSLFIYHILPKLHLQQIS